MFPINNEAGKEMAGGTASSGNWRNWCRLCAKEDEQNRNIYLNEEFVHNEEHTTAERLISVINKYFSVEMQMLDILPQKLCTECLSFLKTLISFQRRVVKVQQMYAELKNLSEANIETKALRLKCQLMDAMCSEGSLVTSMVIKLEEEGEEVARAVEGVSNLQSEEVVIKQVEEEVATADEGVCDFQSEQAADCEVNQSGTAPKGSVYRDKKDHSEADISEGEATAKQAAAEYKYFCMKCPRGFQMKSAYSYHLNKKHGIMLNTTHSCSTCQRKFKDYSSLKRHMHTHRPKADTRIYPCPQCDRKFQTKDYVATHIKFMHENNRPLKCKVCGLAATRQCTLRQHMLTHSDYAPFECDVCKKCFKSKSRLKCHMDTHSAEKHICSECGLQLNSRTTLRRHMVVHSDVMKYRCDYCGKNFKRPTSFKRHLMRHSGLKTYSCEFCDKKFWNSTNCSSHMNRTHPSEWAEMQASGEWKPTKNIPSLAMLKAIIKKGENLVPVVSASKKSAAQTRHMQNKKVENVVPVVSGGKKSVTQTRHKQKQHPKAETSKYACSQCDRKFLQMSNLCAHIKFMHENVRPVESVECGMAVATNTGLGEHMITHTDYAPFECDVCKKCFKKKSYLMTHMEIHSAKKYECSECGLHLNTRYIFLRHIRRLHANLKKHKCDYCGKIYKHPYSLRKHLIQHSGMNRLACKLCAKTFMSGDMFLSHMKLTHPSEMAKMPTSFAVLKSIIDDEKLVAVEPKCGKKSVTETVDADCAKMSDDILQDPNVEDSKEFINII